MTSVIDDRCDEGHVTGSRDEEPGRCAAGVWLEGVAGPEQVDLRYDLVVQSATTTHDHRCVVDTNTDHLDAFSVHVLPGKVIQVKVNSPRAAYLA